MIKHLSMEDHNRHECAGIFAGGILHETYSLQIQILKFGIYDYKAVNGERYIQAESSAGG